jgi:hypothetical protein
MALAVRREPTDVLEVLLARLDINVLTTAREVYIAAHGSIHQARRDAWGLRALISATILNSCISLETWMCLASLPRSEALSRVEALNRAWREQLCRIG